MARRVQRTTRLRRVRRASGLVAEGLLAVAVGEEDFFVGLGRRCVGQGVGDLRCDGRLDSRAGSYAT